MTKNHTKKLSLSMMIFHLKGSKTVSLLVLSCLFLCGCSATSAVLRIDTEPKSAKVILDGNPLEEETPFILSEIKEGEHQIKVVYPKYIHIDTIFTISGGNTYVFFFELEPDFGTLFVSTVPESASVSIHSEDPGTYIENLTAPVKMELSPGSYEVTISEGDNYDVRILPVQIERGKEVRLEGIQLSLKLTSVRVVTEPDGCRVWLDETPCKGQTPLLVRNVEPGDHLIRIEQPSSLYLPIEQPVSITQVDTIIHYVLEQNFGTLSISTHPEGADVLIEPERQGLSFGGRTTPATIELPPGDYTINLSRGRFYETILKDIHIENGQLVRISEKLSPIPFLRERFIRVPSGWFDMGNQNGNSDERPVHQIFLSEYWIAKCELSVEEYSEFVKATNYDVSIGGENCNWGKPDRKSHPVDFVSWYDAKAYAKWFSKRTGLSCRLPTEAEWESAARGPRGWIYPWGNKWNGKAANFCDKRCSKLWKDELVDDGYSTTAPVGSYHDGKSLYGVYDLAGNVSEWCEDYYSAGYYSGSPKKNPLNKTISDYRVVRGGSWDDFPERLESSLRLKFSPDGRFDNVGFRLVVSGEHKGK